MDWKETRSHREVVIEIIETEKAKIIAEIGVWKSGLAKTILRKCANIITEYWGIDPWKDYDSYEEFEPNMERYEKTTPEGWENAYFYACRLMYYFPQLHIVRGIPVRAAKLFSPEHFDLVFIDADHRYEGALTDIKTWLPLVKKGGILSGHDYKPSHPGVMKAVDEIIGKDITIVRDGSVWVKRI